MRLRIRLVYSVVKRRHEPIPPVGSDGYALTGNVTAGSFHKFIRTLMGDAVDPDSSGSGGARLLEVRFKYLVSRLAIEQW